MRTLAVTNTKGGVGKTSLAVHLAAGLAQRKRRVLLIDLDPQANATQWLLGALPDDAQGIADALLRDRPLGDGHLIDSASNGLTVAPATAELSRVDLALASEVAGETTLRRSLEPLRRRFDMVVLDCPGNLGMSVLNAFCAADAVIAPVRAAFMSLMGLRRLEETAKRIRERLNVGTYVLGYVLFAVDPREAITSETREILKQEAGAKLFRSEIRISTAAKALPARRLTAWTPGADARGREDYQAILAETLSRLSSKRTLRKKRAK